MNSILRPMSTSEVLDRMFHLYRNNFLLFTGIALIASSVSLAAQLVSLFAFGAEADLMTNARWGSLLFSYGVTSIAFLFGYALASGATMDAVSKVHLGKQTTIRESYAKVWPSFWRILRIIFLVYTYILGPILLSFAALIIVGTLIAKASRGGVNSPAPVMAAGIAALVAFLCMIAALVWMCIASPRYSLAVPASVLEEVPARQAMRRSRFLTRGSIGRVWLIFLITGVMTFALSYLLQLPVLLLNGTMFITAGVHLTKVSTLCLYVAHYLSSALAGPIATVAVALLYYDERIRKEAYDLQLMAQAISAPSPDDLPMASSANV
jgi:hypothetical protein